MHLVEGGQANDLLVAMRQKALLVFPVGILQEHVQVEWLTVGQIVVPLLSPFDHVVPIFAKHCLLVQSNLHVLLLVQQDLWVDNLLNLLFFFLKLLGGCL